MRLFKSGRPVAGKYGNIKANGHDSKKEARRGRELKLLESGGYIRNLKSQVHFVLIPAQYVDGKLIERALAYTADYVYDEPSSVGPGWQMVVEDVKGYPNDRWPTVRKLMLFVHGIRVRVT